MKMNDILNAIRELAASQGFYGRLLRSLMDTKRNDPDRYGKIVETLEAQHFGDAVDMVLFFEQ